VKEKHTYVMYIVKLNNVPSEGCDTSQANDPHKITFEIMKLLLFFIYKILFNILGPSCPHIFYFILFYLDLHVPNFLAPCLSSQKGKKGYL